MNIDSETLLNKFMQDNQGCLPLDEQATPKEIEIAFKMSKAAYKRAIGRLLMTKKIVKTENGYRLVI